VIREDPENMLSVARTAARGGHARWMPNWKLPAAIALARNGERAQAHSLVLEYLLSMPSDPVALALCDELARAHGP